MTVLASPIAHWHDRLSAGLVTRMYWAFNAATSTWFLVPERHLEAGRFADLTGSGAFVLTPLASIPSLTPVQTSTRRADGTILTYRGAA